MLNWIAFMMWQTQDEKWRRCFENENSYCWCWWCMRWTVHIYMKDNIITMSNFCHQFNLSFISCCLYIRCIGEMTKLKRLGDKFYSKWKWKNLVIFTMNNFCFFLSFTWLTWFFDSCFLSFFRSFNNQYKCEQCYSVSVYDYESYKATPFNHHSH